MRELSTPISRPIDISFLRDYMVDSHPQSFRMGQQEDAAELLFHLVRDLRVELDHVVPVDAAFDDDFDWVGDVDVGGDEFLETLPVDILVGRGCGVCCTCSRCCVKHNHMFSPQKLARSTMHSPKLTVKQATCHTQLLPKSSH